MSMKNWEFTNVTSVGSITTLQKIVIIQYKFVVSVVKKDTVPKIVIKHFINI